ncbi:hypothetical protein SDC9_190506 [bioreactor metagenome]|uniref:Uncharacterized protein n=1 Tax=bioreactor metagenome TaxID=1076179 RepID=A0A645HVA0_9ZZZZ
MSRNIFDMGSDWNVVKQKYKLSNNDMFYYFNKPILDDALSSGKIIRFSHNPLGDDGFLGMEWDHIKSMTGLSDSNLFYEGGFWYIK